jgi:hypothetical protein
MRTRYGIVDYPQLIGGLQVQERKGRSCTFELSISCAGKGVNPIGCSLTSDLFEGIIPDKPGDTFP